MTTYAIFLVIAAMWITIGLLFFNILKLIARGGRLKKGSDFGPEEAEETIEMFGKWRLVLIGPFLIFLALFWKGKD